MNKDVNEVYQSFLNAYWQGKQVKELSLEELREAFWITTIAKDQLHESFKSYVALQIGPKLRKTHD